MLCHGGAWDFSRFLGAVKFCKATPSLTLVQSSPHAFSQTDQGLVIVPCVIRRLTSNLQRPTICPAKEGKNPSNAIPNAQRQTWLVRAVILSKSGVARSSPLMSTPHRTIGSSLTAVAARGREDNSSALPL